MGDIGYATGGFSDRDVEAALDAVAEAGFSSVEILGQDPHLAVVPKGQALSDFRSRLDARGFCGRTVHAPLRHNVPGPPEETWRREKVGVLSEYIRFAGAIGASGIVVHTVPNPIFVPEPDDPRAIRLMRDAAPRSLDQLVPIAEESGVRILLENLPYDCAYPYLDMQTLRPLVDGYPPGALGLCIDTGHAWTRGDDPVGGIRAAGPRLWGAHLQDVDHDDPQDNHWPPTHGDLDWDAVRSALDEVGYAGLWTFEVGQGRHDETPDELARITRAVATAWGLDA